jgi:hypothetical protein
LIDPGGEVAAEAAPKRWWQARETGFQQGFLQENRRMNPNDLKENQLLVTIVAFNVVVIVLMLLFVILRGGFSYVHLADFVIVLFLAGGVAGGAYVFIERM